MACSDQAGEDGIQTAVPKVWSHMGETLGRTDENDAINANMDRVAKARGAAVALGKIEERHDIKGCGAMRTPGVSICGKVVHAGGVPSREKFERWLSVFFKAVTSGRGNLSSWPRCEAAASGDPPAALPLQAGTT